MLDIEKTEEKLKKIYVEICEEEGIYTKESIIELFQLYDFDGEEIEITPVGKHDECDERNDYGDITFDDEILLDEIDEEDFELEYDNCEESLYYSDNILDDLEEYPDEQTFFVELPDEVADSISSNKFREYIFSNIFTNEERNYIFELLIDGTLKYGESEHISRSNEEKHEIKKFMNSCNINDFIYRYVTDMEFCKFVFDVYSIIYFELINSLRNNHNNSLNKVTSINDLIREKLTSIHNRNVSMGTLDSNSILIISKYLTGEIDSKSMNTIYKKQLGNLNIEDISNRDYMKIIMITDYLRMCELKYNNSSQIDKVDKEYLDFIDKSSSKEILKRFNEDNDFAFNVISQFIELNLWCSNETKSSCKNVKQIKKINPLYTLDFMKKDN